MKNDERVTSENIRQVDETRRAALQRMGKYAAYTAPTLVALLVAGQAGAGGGPRLSVACPAGRPDRPPQC